jgi:hypothetical protein
MENGFFADAENPESERRVRGITLHVFTTAAQGNKFRERMRIETGFGTLAPGRSSGIELREELRLVRGLSSKLSCASVRM